MLRDSRQSGDEWSDAADEEREKKSLLDGLDEDVTSLSSSSSFNLKNLNFDPNSHSDLIVSHVVDWRRSDT